MKLILIALALFGGCRSGNVLEENYGHICGREPPRKALWRAEVPPEWEACETKGELSDTREPNQTYRCANVTVWVHTFPNPIPPSAQIARWQRQLKEPGLVTPCHGSGYVGLKLEGEEMLAWALALDPRHLASLQGEARSNVTIKAVGPKTELALLRPEIERLALSFEMVDEVPR